MNYEFLSLDISCPRQVPNSLPFVSRQIQLECILKNSKDDYQIALVRRQTLRKKYLTLDSLSRAFDSSLVTWSDRGLVYMTGIDGVCSEYKAAKNRYEREWSDVQDTDQVKCLRDEVSFYITDVDHFEIQNCVARCEYKMHTGDDMPSAEELKKIIHLGYEKKHVFGLYSKKLDHIEWMQPWWVDSFKRKILYRISESRAQAFCIMNHVPCSLFFNTPANAYYRQGKIRSSGFYNGTLTKKRVVSYLLSCWEEIKSRQETYRARNNFKDSDYELLIDLLDITSSKTSKDDTSIITKPSIDSDTQDNTEETFGTDWFVSAGLYRRSSTLIPQFDICIQKIRNINNPSIWKIGMYQYESYITRQLEYDEYHDIVTVYTTQVFWLNGCKYRVEVKLTRDVIEAMRRGVSIYDYCVSKQIMRNIFTRYNETKEKDRLYIRPSGKENGRVILHLLH